MTQRNSLFFLAILTLTVGCGDFSFGKKEEKNSGSGSQNASAVAPNPTPTPQPVASQATASNPMSTADLISQLVKSVNITSLLTDPRVLNYVDITKLQQLILDKGSIENLAKDPNLLNLILGVLKPLNNTSTSTSTSTSVNLVK